MSRDRGDSAEASSRYREALALMLRLGDQRTAADALEGLAHLARADAQPLRAAQYLGATAILRDRSEASSDPRRTSWPMLSWSKPRATRSARRLSPPPGRRVRHWRSMVISWPGHAEVASHFAWGVMCDTACAGTDLASNPVSFAFVVLA